MRRWRQIRGVAIARLAAARNSGVQSSAFRRHVELHERRAYGVAAGVPAPYARTSRRADPPRSRRASGTSVPPAANSASHGVWQARRSRGRQHRAMVSVVPGEVLVAAVAVQGDGHGRRVSSDR